MQIQHAVVALIFSVGPLTFVSSPVLADSIAAQPITLRAFSNGGVNEVGFDFAAWGDVYLPYIGEIYQGTAPTTLSFTWDKTFELPASPPGDYFEVTRVNTYAVASGNIIINGQPYDRQDDIDFSPPPFPDADLYKLGGYFEVYTVPMNLHGPISVHLFGDFTRQFDASDCCYITAGEINVYSFEQFLQIERFHPNGTLDPFPPVPEPQTSALTFIGLLGIVIGALWRVRRCSSAVS